MQKGFFLNVTILLLLLTGSLSQAGELVCLQDLGTLGNGSNSEALWINDAGQIVGISEIANNVASHAFLWESGIGMQNLGTLGGSNSFAVWINNSGQAVGSSETAEGMIHAFLWERRTAGRHNQRL